MRDAYIDIKAHKIQEVIKQEHRNALYFFGVILSGFVLYIVIAA